MLSFSFAVLFTNEIIFFSARKNSTLCSFVSFHQQFLFDRAFCGLKSYEVNAFLQGGEVQSHAVGVAFARKDFATCCINNGIALNLVRTHHVHALVCRIWI